MSESGKVSPCQPEWPGPKPVAAPAHCLILLHQATPPAALFAAHRFPFLPGQLLPLQPPPLPPLPQPQRSPPPPPPTPTPTLLLPPPTRPLTPVEAVVVAADKSLVVTVAVMVVAVQAVEEGVLVVVGAVLVAIVVSCRGVDTVPGKEVAAVAEKGVSVQQTAANLPTAVHRIQRLALTAVAARVVVIEAAVAVAMVTMVRVAATRMPVELTVTAALAGNALEAMILQMERKDQQRQDV